MARKQKYEKFTEDGVEIELPVMDQSTTPMVIEYTDGSVQTIEIPSDIQLHALQQAVTADRMMAVLAPFMCTKQELVEFRKTAKENKKKLDDYLKNKP